MSREPSLLQRMSESRRWIVLLGCGCFDLKMSARCRCDMMVPEELTLKATGDLFVFLSFRSWETSTVNGPGWRDWSAGRPPCWQSTGSLERDRATYGGSQVPADQFRQTWLLYRAQKRMANLRMRSRGRSTIEAGLGCGWGEVDQRAEARRRS